MEGAYISFDARNRVQNGPVLIPVNQAFLLLYTLVSGFCPRRMNSLALTDIRKYMNMTLEVKEGQRAGPGVAGRASGRIGRANDG